MSKTDSDHILPPPPVPAPEPANRLRRVLWLILMLTALWACFLWLKAPSLNLTDFSLERQSKSFLLVSALKSSLAVIEGSDAGVMFRVEFGDVIQPTYDLVDFTWKMLLYGILLITFSKIFYESRLIDVGIYLLALGVGLRILGLYFVYYRDQLHRLGSGVIIAGLIVSFYIPVSTVVSFQACEYFVDNIEQDLDTQLAEVISEWDDFRDDLSLKNVNKTLLSTTAFVKRLFLNLTRILITYTCLIIIRYLLFPLIVAYGFFLASKTFVRKRFE